MARTAQIDRETSETQDLARARPRRWGGRRRGGDDRRRLPRPHARPARPSRPARPAHPTPPGIWRTGSRRTVEDVERWRSARRSTRRSATARDPPLRPRRAADGRGARRSARSTSPGGRSACSARDLPPVSIAGFEAELTEEFFRAVATNAKLTLHLSNPYGSNAHHMIEACFKAFARALATRSRSIRTNPACLRPRAR